MAHCSKCGRPRSGHELPFGPNCKLPPVTPEEKRLIEERGGTVIDVTPAEEPPVQDEAAELLRRRDELLKEQEATRKAIEAQKKKEEEQLELERLREEVQNLTLSLQEEQEKLKALSDRVNAVERPRARTPAAEVSPSGSPRPAARRPRPGEQDDGGIDPTMAVYARALADAQADAARRAGAVGPEMAEGVRAKQFLEDNPILAAACGLGSVAKKKPMTDGKSLPEQFMWQRLNAEKERDIEKVSYYQFIHGLFRMLHLRLSEDHKPVDDMIKYYEAITGFACNYKWQSVYRLHNYLVSEIEDGRRQWQDPIHFTHAYFWLNSESVIIPRDSERRSRSSTPRGGARDRDRDGGSRDGAARHVTKREGTCNDYNKVKGCDYGANCKYWHYCEDCYKQGKKLEHPVFFCNAKQSTGTGK